METEQKNKTEIELKTVKNVEYVESKPVCNEYTAYYVKIRLERKEMLDSVVAYANMIGEDPDSLLTKILHSGIKEIRSHMNGLPHTTAKKIHNRFLPFDELEELLIPGC